MLCGVLLILSMPVISIVRRVATVCLVLASMCGVGSLRLWVVLVSGVMTAVVHRLSLQPTE